MDITDSVLSAYHAEHAESSADWRQLETKLSATIVLAGAFLAATIAVSGKALVAPGWLEVLAAFLALLAIFSGIFRAVWALRTRDVEMPPDGNLIGKVLAAASRRKYADDAHRKRVVARLLRWHWYRATDDIQRCNRHKRDALARAQALVLLGGILAAAFGLLRLSAASFFPAG